MYLLQIISLVIWGIVFFSACFRFKQTVLIWVPVSLLFNPQWAVTYNPPITALTVAVDLSLVLLYFIRFNGKSCNNVFNNEPFFLKPVVFLFFLSYILATICSEMPFMSSFNRFVKQLFDYFGVIFLVFKCLNTKEDILLFVKCLLISAFIFCVNGIIEFAFQENFWGDFIYYNSRCDETTLGRGWHTPYEIRGGLKMRFGMMRCYSLFTLHLIYGFASCLVLYVVLFLLKTKELIFANLSKNINVIFYWILFFLLLLSVIVCNSKGPMIFVFFIFLSHFKFSRLFNIWTLFCAISIIIVVLIYFPDYINNFISLTDEQVAEEGGGSTIQMREMQYDAAMRLFSRSPLFGNGIDAVSYYKKNGLEDILGAESVWFRLLPDQGVFGVFVYLFMYIMLFTDATKYVPSRLFLYYFIGIFVFDTTNGSCYGKLIWWISIYLLIRRCYIIGFIKND